MARLTIILGKRTSGEMWVGYDNALIQVDLTGLVAADVWAMQWHDTYGEVEYNDGKINATIHDLNDYQQAIAAYDAKVNAPPPPPTPQEKRNKADAFVRYEYSNFINVYTNRIVWEELKNADKKLVRDYDTALQGFYADANYPDIAAPARPTLEYIVNPTILIQPSIVL